jgi:hypothetical protein
VSIKLPVPKSGVILESKEGSLYKRAILCREGIWDGTYGTVHVTRPLLDMLAARYNVQRAKPLNDNDYAPVLKNHNRDVDGVLGRLLTPLVVEDFTDPETGIVAAALFGPIRIDDPEAQEKVEKGKYAQGSLNFDEQGQTEIFEWSFVAVEAARRSQVLEQGDKTMSVELQKLLDAANAKHNALAARFASQKLARREVVLAMGNCLAQSQLALTSFETQMKEVSLQIRALGITSQLRGYIREGKMSKAEFDKVNVKELCALDPAAAKMVLSAYEGRKPSTDIVQHGQEGAQPIALKALPAAEIRAMVDAQLSGKEYTPKLAQLDAADGDPKPGKEKEPKEGGDSESKFSDVEDTLKKLNEVMPGVAKLREHMKAMDEAIGKMKGSDEDDAAA